MYFYSINKFLFNKICLYNIKICFLFSQNKFVLKKKYSCYLNFFHPIKTFFYYMNFSFDTFLVTISGLPFSFAKVSTML